MRGVVSILGCGYLGYPVAVRLVEEGWKVRGSTTTKAKLPQLRDAGIDAYQLCAPDRVQVSGFFECDRLVLNVPPGGRRADVHSRYRAVVESVANAAQNAGVEHILFVGSTSVYGNQAEDFIEEDAGKNPPRSASGRVLLWAERMLRRRFTITVLRLGGLYGYGRPPGRFVRGVLQNPQLPVNMVHRDDAMAAVCAVLDEGIWGETFNVCAPKHPSRAEFYGAAAGWLGRPAPQAGETDRLLFRQISSRKLERQLRFTFQYPDPLIRAP